MMTVLAPEDRDRWLTCGCDEVVASQRPYPAARMTVRGPRVPDANGNDRVIDCDGDVDIDRPAGSKRRGPLGRLQDASHLHRLDHSEQPAASTRLPSTTSSRTSGPGIGPAEQRVTSGEAPARYPERSLCKKPSAGPPRPALRSAAARLACLGRAHGCTLPSPLSAPPADHAGRRLPVTSLRSSSHLQNRRSEASAAGHFDPLRVDPAVVLGQERGDHGADVVGQTDAGQW